MTTIAMLVLGWCVLSLPIGIVVGNLLRGPRPQPILRRNAGPGGQLPVPQHRVAA